MVEPKQRADMHNHLNRRSFMAAAGFLGLSLAGRHLLPPTKVTSLDSQGTSPEEYTFAQSHPARLDLWGRITDDGTPVRTTTGLGTPVAGFLRRNTVLPLFEEVHAPGSNPNNDLWYRVRDGFLYTSSVQRIKPYHMPEAATQLDDTFGFWAEVIVPYSLARTQPGGPVASADDGSQTVLYYASVYHVIGVEADEAGYLWYKLKDDKPHALPIYGLARHLRRITEADLAPIHPGADKRIIVTLDKQRIDCYEADNLVYSTLTSSGGAGFETPRGEWWVVLKQPSRHMYSDPELEAFSDPNYFDLPGVPFNTFFTTMGNAIHGTYWHGDFGRPRSHGCLNVTPEAARWIYRWVDPVASYSSDFVPADERTGTHVVVK